MCDYSLHYVKSRPAKVGDKLTRTILARALWDSRQRKMSSYSGLRSTWNRAELRQPGYMLASWYVTLAGESDKAQHGLIFRQINKERLHAHHDALEFPNGQIVLLTLLDAGQEATVLQLPAEPKTAIEAEAQKSGGLRRLNVFNELAAVAILSRVATF